MIILEVVFLILFWSWVASAALFLRTTVLPRRPMTLSPATLNLPAETVHFQATDGTRLEGWKIPADPNRPWIILCHGMGSNRSDLLSVAQALQEARFNLFLFDFRGHGGSAGWVTSFGWREQRDLEGALAFLGQQADVPATPYGIYGISFGGAVALMVAAKDERIGALAVDGPYANLEHTMARHLNLMYPFFPFIPLLWFITATYRIRFGIWPRRVSPQHSATNLGRRPLLLIQGGNDLRTPPEEANRIVSAVTGPKERWIVEGAGHLEAYAINPSAYIEKIVQFFQRSLEPA